VALLPVFTFLPSVHTQHRKIKLVFWRLSQRSDDANSLRTVVGRQVFSTSFLCKFCSCAVSVPSSSAFTSFTVTDNTSVCGRFPVEKSTKLKGNSGLTGTRTPNRWNFAQRVTECKSFWNCVWKPFRECLKVVVSVWEYSFCHGRF